MMKGKKKMGFDGKQSAREGGRHTCFLGAGQGREIEGLRA